MYWLLEWVTNQSGKSFSWSNAPKSGGSSNSYAAVPCSRRARITDTRVLWETSFRGIRTYRSGGEVLRLPKGGPPLQGRRARRDSARPGRRYISSMPKLGATPAKTVQLKFANLLDFRGFPRVLWHRVSPEIALVTRRSSVQICPPQPTGTSTDRESWQLIFTPPPRCGT